jgi:hypothetical protein
VTTKARAHEKQEREERMPKIETVNVHGRTVNKGEEHLAEKWSGKAEAEVADAGAETETSEEAAESPKSGKAKK